MQTDATVGQLQAAMTAGTIVSGYTPTIQHAPTYAGGYTA